MNRPITMAALCGLLAACGVEPGAGGATQIAHLRASDPCVDDACAEGLVCMRYGLGQAAEKRCVHPDSVCSIVECTEGSQCVFFTGSPATAVCAIITSSL